MHTPSILAPTVSLSLLVASTIASAQVCEDPASVISVGESTLGEVRAPELSHLGLPAIGGAFPQLVIDDGVAGGLGLALLGFDSTPTFLPAFGGTLFPNPDITAMFSLDASGRAVVDPGAGVTLGPGLCGFFVSAQAFTADPAAMGGFAFTNALEIQIGSAPDEDVLGGQRFDIPTSASLTDFAAGDFNQDGNVDVFAVGFGGGPSILFGNGRGDFRPAGSAPLGTGNFSAVSVDINGDTFPDIAASNTSGTGGLSFHLNNGNGTFGAATILPGPFAPAIAVGDVSGDGIEDVVLGGSQLFVHLGTDAGTLAGPVTSPLPFGADPNGLELVDLDGDNDLDALVVSNEIADSVGAFLNDGAGNFTIASGSPFLSGSFSPSGMGVADFNNDGDLDLAVSHIFGAGPTTVAFFQGDGTGGFTPAGDMDIENLSPTDALAGDFTADGNNDLLLSSSSNNSVTLLEGQGDGSFASAVHFAGGGSLGTIVATDVNSDGIEDVLGFNTGASDFTVHLGTGDNRAFTSSRVFRTDRRPNALAAADLTGDGILDVVTANTFTGSISLLPGLGGGELDAPVTLTGFADAVDVNLEDVDLDGDVDVVITETGVGFISLPPAIVVLPNPGNGDISSVTPIVTPTALAPSQFTLGDIDGDQIPDLVAVNAGDNSVSTFIGNGAGQFTTPTTFPTGTAGPSTPRDAHLARLNDDDALDLIVVNDGGNLVDGGSISIFLGQGDGTFAGPQIFDSGFGRSQNAAIGDSNGDGHLDLAIANLDVSSLNGGVDVLLGAGDGTFGVPTRLDGTNVPTFVAFEDLNGDGFDDVASSAEVGGPSLWIHLSNGNSFEDVVEFANANGIAEFTPGLSTAGGASALAVGDMDGNGRLDLLTTNIAFEFFGGVSVTLNTTPTPED